MADKTKVTDTPDQHPGLEPPIKESSQQQGMAPAPDEKEKMMPIGKPGVRVKSKKFGKSTTS
ncbi:MULTISPECIES: hypothetical protein [Rhizobium]|jgi:hypothetical protein|uniref:Uncharacterized protein n=1 Tax=Rhizobium leguminosarum bv. trifolii (strain WSM1325) TaxID=395491 RepID=C6B966_RHILS|nr:hypothetical protein [Rhizobium leguminosarum]ACS60454.1 hypothetical protein Rleg_5647 [Rhizobium leguminosarum bv. trifolii WSM1325]MBY2912276.1 hypothetical protein [Rhizobium leguminosarum]MBY2945192.1 hypothetical protein [Rhizobium leguminosarum]MBY2952181.1 hypothetical protein [Rhizobium leguminosarum]MBY2967928.1 hypothetical protein [Rhizobium leguminosarum]